MKKLILVLGMLLPVQATAAVLTADLQPYSICTATGCADTSFDARIFAETWEQADITFDILPPRRTSQIGITTARPGQFDANDALGAFRMSVPKVRPHTVYVGFAEALDGVYGIAYRNTPETRLFPFAILESGMPPRVAGLVAAHEVGHLLGATHVADAARENLMYRGVPARTYADAGFVPPILAETRSVVRSSPLLVAVPAPPSLALGVSVLLLASIWAGRSRGSRHL